MFPASRSRSGFVALMAAALIVGLLPATALAAAPVAAHQDVNTSEDAALLVVLTGTDPDGDLLTFAIDTQASNGAVSAPTNTSCDGNTPSACTAEVTYTPSENFNGSDSFTYSVNDGVDGPDTATIDVTVDPVNDAPVASDGTASTNEGVVVGIDLGDSASDVETADGDLAYTIGSGPTHGGLSGSGKVRTYTPDPNYNGPDSFTFKVTDRGDPDNCGAPVLNVCTGALDSATTTIDVTVAAVNDAPVNTVPGAQTTSEDNALVLSGGNKMSVGDVDLGGGDLQETLTATHGTITLSGTTGLTFTTGDGTGDATMTFTGSLSDVNAALDGLAYDPAPDYNGPADLTILSDDQGNTGSGGSKTDTDDVTITVSEVNDAPVAGDDTATVNEDGTVDIDVLANDSAGPPDEAGQQLTISIATPASHGTATVDDNGTPSIMNDDFVTYVPVADYQGSDSFTYTVCDDGTTDGVPDPICVIVEATVDVTVAAVNDASAGTDGSTTIDEDTGYTFGASDFGFTDPNDNPANAFASVVITTLPAAGSLELLGVPVSALDEIPVGDLGDLVFNPAANANGSPYASFTFQVRDDGGTALGGIDLDQSPNTFTIAVSSVNDAPAGSDGSTTIDEDTGYTFGASDFGFTDPNDNPANAFASVVITTLPAAGSLELLGVQVIAGDEIDVADLGDLVFSPAANANGSPYASFTFQVRDDGGTALGGVDLDPSANTFTITVTAVNDAPAGTDGTVNTHEDTAYTFTPGDFGLTDAADSPADALLAVKITTIPGAGSLTNDGSGVSATAFVLASDIAASKLRFTPAAGATGAPYTTFTFQVQDDGGTTNGGVDLDQSANVMTIDVAGINHAPGGTDKTITINEDEARTLVAADFGFSDLTDPGDLLAAVRITTLPSGDSLADDGVSVVAGGSVSVAHINANKLVYTPALNANGSPHATFTFQVQDNGGTANGGVDLDQSANSITIDVTPVNDNPIATTDYVTVSEDAAATPVDVLANDTDVEGDARTTTVKTDGGKGVVVITGGGTGVTYKPNANANGSDSFTYTISDGHGGIGVGTVNVTITPTNDLPNAGSDVGLTVPESAGPMPLSVSGNDTDIDGDTLTIISVTPAAHGTVAITGGGTGITYDPVQLYYGTDAFTYTVSDGHGGTDPATVLLTVVKDTTAPSVAAPAQSFYAQSVGTKTTRVRIGWSASDAGTGVGKYDLQVSYQGGAWKGVGLASATSTSVAQTLTDAKSYRFRVRATDRQGNVSGWVYGPTFKPGRFQNTSTSVKYAGKWTNKSTSSALGGSYRYASATSARVIFTRVVRDFAWVTTRTAGSGSAQVWIDGVLAATVNLRASKTSYRQLVFSRHFSTLANHRIEIRPIGGGIVSFDAFLLTH